MSDQPNPHQPQPDDTYVIEREALLRLGAGDIRQGRKRLRLLLADEHERAPINAPTERPAGVRLARPEDEPALVELILEDLAENATKIAPPCGEQISRMIEVGTRGGGGYVAVAEEDGRIVGLAVLHPMRWWWASEWFLQEVVMYVTPSARRSDVGARILKFERWIADLMSEARGYRVFLLAGVTATKRGDAKMRLYRRSMNPVGGFCIYPAIEGLAL